MKDMMGHDFLLVFVCGRENQATLVSTGRGRDGTSGKKPQGTTPPLHICNQPFHLSGYLPNPTLIFERRFVRGMAPRHICTTRFPLLFFIYCVKAAATQSVTGRGD